MKIEDLPRPWLLAAMTGVPMSVLLKEAEKERAEQAERAWQTLLGQQYRRWRPPVRRRPEPRAEQRSLAS